jgi:tripartite-type tricarboxylate transporter receptor subunit TctC
MKRMKRMYLVLLAFVMIVSLLSGCTSTTKPAATIETTTEKKVVDFPKKEITLIVPWNPGGANDVVARHLQPIFKDKFDANLIIKNVPGGGSAVGITEVLTAKNDGYTLGLATSSFISLVAQELAQADMSKIENICLIMEDPIAVVCKTGKYETVKDFIEDAKSRPGKAILAMSGTNNPSHVYSALLEEVSGADINLMSYDGGSRCVTELLGGHADISVSNYGDFVSQIEAGELKVISIMTKDRISTLPDVPTIIESGYDVFGKGFIRQFSYVMAPAGLDPDVKEALKELFVQAVATEEFQTLSKERNFLSPGTSGKDMDDMINSTYEGMKAAAAEIFNK